jgi:hypothetical protein
VLHLWVVNFAVVSYAIAQAKSAGTNSVSSWFETRFVLSWDDSVLLKKYNEALNLYISKGPEYKTKYEAWQKRCVDVADNQIAFLGSVKRDGMIALKLLKTCGLQTTMSSLNTLV